MSRFPPNLDVSVCWIYQGNYMLSSIRRSQKGPMQFYVRRQMNLIGLDYLSPCMRKEDCCSRSLIISTYYK